MTAGGVVVEDGRVFAAAGLTHYDGTHVVALDAKSGELIVENDTSGSASIMEVANPGDIEFRVEASGNVLCDGAFTGGGADYAEYLEMLAPGEFHDGRHDLPPLTDTVHFLRWQVGWTL